MIMVFTHAAVAIDRDRGHARAPRMTEKRAQAVERLLGALAKRPAARSNPANASLVRFGKQRRGAGGQVGDFIVHILARKNTASFILALSGKANINYQIKCLFSN